MILAVNDLVSAPRRYVRHFARLWFESDNHEPGSFLWICDHTEIDASWLRRRLFAIVDQGSPVLTHMVSAQRRPAEIPVPILEPQLVAAERTVAG